MQDVHSDGFGWRENGRGAPLLLLHGLGGSRLSWESQLAALGTAYRVAAWDLPGYGDSDPLEETTFTALAAAVGCWADVLGIETFHLAGISMGGMIAQHVAAAMPARVRTLALLATSAKFGLDGTSPAEWRAARLAPLDRGERPADFAEGVLRGLAGPAISDEALAGQVAAMRRVTAAGLRRAVECVVTHDTRHLLADIAVPTAVLVGALDSETPPAYAAALHAGIAGSTLHVIPGAGHLLNAEAPSAVDEILCDLARR